MVSSAEIMGAFSTDVDTVNLHRSTSPPAHSPYRYGLPGTRGSHSSTFRLNVNTFCGIAGAFRSC
jgi:hypothetical protein